MKQVTLIIRKVDLVPGQCRSKSRRATSAQTEARAQDLPCDRARHAHGAMVRRSRDTRACRFLCESKAIGKDGRELAGAARTAFLAKCKREACAPKAVASDGKPLKGAAKNSFMAKCVREQG